MKTFNKKRINQKEPKITPEDMAKLTIVLKYFESQIELYEKQISHLQKRVAKLEGKNVKTT